jgi:hypothetical protein
MIATIAEIAAFLANNSDLIEELFDAIKGGTPKDALKALIRQAKADASWAALQGELFADGSAPPGQSGAV